MTPEELIDNFAHKLTDKLISRIAHDAFDLIMSRVADLAKSPRDRALIALICVEYISAGIVPAVQALAYGDDGRKITAHPDLDARRFTALLIHNLTLRDKESIGVIIEQTAREYATRYENISTLGEALDRLIHSVRKI